MNEKGKKSIVWNSYLNKIPNSAQLAVVFEALSLRKDLLLVSGKSLQCNNVLSSFVCREWLLGRLLASGTDCSIAYDSKCPSAPIMCAVSFFPFIFLLLSALCCKCAHISLCFWELCYFFRTWTYRERYFIHTHTQAQTASVQQVIICKEWSKCVGGKLHCGMALWDWKMSIEEAAIFMHTSSIVLRGELQGAVSLYLHVPLRTWVYLFVSVREDDLPLAGEH